MSEEQDVESLPSARTFRVEWFAPERPTSTTVFVKPAPPAAEVERTGAEPPA